MRTLGLSNFAFLMELHLVLVSWDTGEGWSNRAGKVAYESRRDYIIAVKGKMGLRVTLSTQSESAAFRRVAICGVAWSMTVSSTISSFMPYCRPVTSVPPT